MEKESSAWKEEHQERMTQKLSGKNVFQERRRDHSCQMFLKGEVRWGLTIGLSTLELLTP